MESYGDDGVDAGEDDEWYFEVFGKSFVFHVSFLVVSRKRDGVFTNGIKDIKKSWGPSVFRHCRILNIGVNSDGSSTEGVSNISACKCNTINY